MNIVHVDNLKVGQVLCEDVRDVSSRLLLSKGMAIKSEHQRIFKIWGVTEVMVEGDLQDTPAPEMDLDPDIVERVTAVMENVYANVDRSHPAMRELFWISVDYRSRRGVIEEKPLIEKAGKTGA